MITQVKIFPSGSYCIDFDKGITTAEAKKYGTKNLIK
jgi:hypothetical protein